MAKKKAKKLTRAHLEAIVGNALTVAAAGMKKQEDTFGGEHETRALLVGPLAGALVKAAIWDYPSSEIADALCEKD